MDLTAAMDFVEAHDKGVLTTLRGDGRPQLSNIVYVVVDGEIRISVTDGRAKTANARRDPRVALHVTREDFWAYVVVEGDGELLPVAADPHDATVDALVDYYERSNGEPHPDWDEYRTAMVADRRLLVTLRPSHAYGMLGR